MLSKTALVKIKNTKRQSSLKSYERKENIKDAFEVVDVLAVTGKNIILLDDVYTTGATLEECAKALKMAGAKNILGIVIAKD